MQLCLTVCFYLLLSATMAEIRSRGLLLLLSHKPTNTAPRSAGLSTVPIIDCAVHSRELLLERFAFTTE